MRLDIDQAACPQSVAGGGGPTPPTDRKCHCLSRCIIRARRRRRGRRPYKLGVSAGWGLKERPFMARSRSPRRARDVRIRGSNKREEERRGRRSGEKAATMTPPPPVESLSRLFALQSVKELPRGRRGEKGHGDGGGGGGERRPSVTPAVDPMMPGRVSPPPR